MNSLRGVFLQGCCFAAVNELAKQQSQRGPTQPLSSHLAGALHRGLSELIQQYQPIGVMGMRVFGWESGTGEGQSE